MIISDKSKSMIKEILDKGKQIGHGNWKIELIFHDGDLVGFDYVDYPLVKIRSAKVKK